MDEYGQDVDLEVDEDDLDRIDNISNNDEEIKGLIENNQAPTQGAIKRISTDDIEALEEGYEEENEEDELDGHYEEDFSSYDDSDDE